MNIDLTVNGKARQLQIQSGDRLVDALRGELSLASLTPDCLSGQCGRCLVFMDGRLVQACLLPAFKAKGSVILTYEAKEESIEAREIQTAFEKAGARPCSFCRIGKTMAVLDLLARKPMPTEDEIVEQLKMVVCACTDAPSLIAAVGIAAEMRNKRKFSRADK